jgi:hypothetical protein
MKGKNEKGARDLIKLKLRKVGNEVWSDTTTHHTTPTSLHHPHLPSSTNFICRAAKISLRVPQPGLICLPHSKILDVPSSNQLDLTNECVSERVGMWACVCGRVGVVCWDVHRGLCAGWGWVWECGGVDGCMCEWCAYVGQKE